MEHTSSHIIREITPLSDKDCFYIVERRKNTFDYPIHTHNVYELNFISGGRGVRRIVGDSVELIGDKELVLVTKSDLEHTWQQGECQQRDVREITLQFAPDLLPTAMLQKNQFLSIGHMFTRAQSGLLFSHDVTEQAETQLNEILTIHDGFDQLTALMKLLHSLSLDDGARELASTGFAAATEFTDSRRVKKVDQYLREHFREEVRLKDLADLVGMSEVGFSRFFRVRTGVPMSAYLINIRIGHATRQLIDTTDTISEIAYSCGFNNISNFNRIFLKYKNLTPLQFRRMYKKTRRLV